MKHPAMGLNQGYRRPRLSWSARPSRREEARAPVTVILLATGDQLEVDASIEEVVKVLENAARSSAGTLARVTRSGTGEAVALNATHVVLVREDGE